MDFPLDPIERLVDLCAAHSLLVLYEFAFDSHRFFLPKFLRPYSENNNSDAIFFASGYVLATQQRILDSSC
jgi:hypothetical protein